MEDVHEKMMMCHSGIGNRSWLFVQESHIITDAVYFIRHAKECNKETAAGYKSVHSIKRKMYQYIILPIYDPDEW